MLKTDNPSKSMNSSDIKIILAPLQGFTDVTFRNVFSNHFQGVDEAVAPFISTMGQQRLKPSRLKDVLPDKNKNLPVVPQILGNVAVDFIFLADTLLKMGHKRINWNLGCPHSKIANKKRGSGLLMYPEMVDALLGDIMPAIANSLSVKIRLGRRSKQEIGRLLPVFEKYHLEEIILHPRTGIQMYEGTSDHDAFEDAVSKCGHRFTYNGDITDTRSFKQVHDRFPQINRFMIGRGILANPFLAEQIKKIGSPSDKALRIKAFHDDLFEGYRAIFSGPSHLTGRMKGFWSYLGPSFKDSKKALKKILKSSSQKKYIDMVEDFFDQNLEFIF